MQVFIRIVGKYPIRTINFTYNYEALFHLTIVNERDAHYRFPFAFHR